MMKKVITRPCFSCGSEADDWLDRNCDHCIKAERLRADGNDYTKCRCVYQQDILTQMFGCGNEPIRFKTYQITHSVKCPYQKTKYPSKKKHEKQLPLFPEL